MEPLTFSADALPKSLGELELCFIVLVVINVYITYVEDVSKCGTEG